MSTEPVPFIDTFKQLFAAFNDLRSVNLLSSERADLQRRAELTHRLHGDLVTLFEYETSIHVRQRMTELERLVSQTCHGCGAHLEDHARFCMRCGRARTSCGCDHAPHEPHEHPPHRDDDEVDDDQDGDFESVAPVALARGMKILDDIGRIASSNTLTANDLALAVDEVLEVPVATALLAVLDRHKEAVRTKLCLSAEHDDETRSLHALTLLLQLRKHLQDRVDLMTANEADAFAKAAHAAGVESDGAADEDEVDNLLNLAAKRAKDGDRGGAA